MKTIAVYLPQYHQIPENDEWWGEGFTDWVAVKDAEKLFEGHNQPREPLNDNYYDLADKESLRWQARLAKQYSVDGFCFYHYYFEDGKKVLEKPAENLLGCKDIDIEYCFCWANDSWARSWSKIYHTNPWAEKYEKRGSSEKEILLQQNYGDIKAWREHFEYLLPFFLDERYIKKDNRPLFIIYRPEEISCLTEMLQCFSEWIQEYGFAGMYIIGGNLPQKMNCLDGILYIHASTYFRPDVTGLSLDLSIYNGVTVRDYEGTWKNMLQAPAVDGIQTYFGGFVDQDDTPRRGTHGYCLSGASPSIFKEYLYKLAVKNLHYGSDYLFIDAWNEWGEGCYLEPDKKNGYAYLEAVEFVSNQINQKEFNQEKEWKKIKETDGKSSQNGNGTLLKEIKKYQACYRVLDRWMRLKEDGKTILPYFEDKRIRKIAIYGYTPLAGHIIKELSNSIIDVVAYIDRRGDFTSNELPVYNLEQEFPECDLIVVTPLFDYEEICVALKNKTETKIVSIEEIVFSIG